MDESRHKQRLIPLTQDIVDAMQELNAEMDSVLGQAEIVCGYEALVSPLFRTALQNWLKKNASQYNKRRKEGGQEAGSLSPVIAAVTMDGSNLMFSGSGSSQTTNKCVISSEMAYMMSLLHKEVRAALSANSATCDIANNVAGGNNNVDGDHLVMENFTRQQRD